MGQIINSKKTTLFQATGMDDVMKITTTMDEDGSTFYDCNSDSSSSSSSSDGGSSSSSSESCDASPMPTVLHPTIVEVQVKLKNANEKLERMAATLSCQEADHGAPTVFDKKTYMDCNILRTDIGLLGEAVLRLIFQLDSVESNGDDTVRASRKAAVKACEDSIAHSETLLKRATALVAAHEELKTESPSTIAIPVEACAKNVIPSSSDITSNNSGADSDTDGSSSFGLGTLMQESSEESEAEMSDDESDSSEGHEPEAHLEEHNDTQIDVVVWFPKDLDIDSVLVQIDEQHGILTTCGRHKTQGRCNFDFSLPLNTLDVGSAQIVSRDALANTLRVRFDTMRVRLQRDRRQAQQRERERMQRQKQYRQKLQEQEQAQRRYHGASGFFANDPFFFPHQQTTGRHPFSVWGF